MDNKQHSPPTVKRRKTKLACERCRCRKVRCDGTRPVCGSCAHRKLGPDQCIYVDQSAEVDPIYVKSLEERIRELEQRRREGSSGQTPHPSIARIAHHDPGSTYVPSIAILDPPAPEPRLAHVSDALQQDYPALQVPGGGGNGRERGPHSIADHGRNLSVAHASDMQPSSAMGAGPGAADGTPTDSSRAAVFLGRSSAAAFIREVQETSGGRRRSVAGYTGNTEDAVSSTASRVSYPRSKKDLNELNAFLDDLILPPRTVADMYLDQYWEFVYPLYPILHKPTFMKRYDRLWNHDQGNGQEAHLADGNIHTLTAFCATFNIVLALGCSYTSPTGPTSASKKSSEVFYKRSQTLITQASVDNGSLQLVQALILTAQYLQSTDLVNTCWVTVGIAIRVAQGIGIQLDLPSESQVERQERKRTWWCCVMMDRVMSMTFGRPPMVVWPTIVPFPESIDDDLLLTAPGTVAQPLRTQEFSKVTFFVQALKLTKILMEVLKHFYAPLPEERPAGVEGARIEDFTSLFSIDANLAQWRRELPERLIYHGIDAMGADRSDSRQALALLCRYLHLRILLFRPTTVELSTGQFIAARTARWTTDFQNSVLTGCIRSCVLAAQELIGLICSGTYVSLNLPWWYAVFYLYTAGTVVLAMLIIPGLRELSSGDHYSLETSWTQCIEGLSMYEQSESSFARKCLRVLKAVHAQASSEAATDYEPEDQFRHEAEAEHMHAPQIQPLSSLPRSGPAVMPWPGHQSAGASTTDNHAGDDIFENWWVAGSLDWLNNLPHDFDEQESFGGTLQR